MKEEEYQAVISKLKVTLCDALMEVRESAAKNRDEVFAWQSIVVDITRRLGLDTPSTKEVQDRIASLIKLEEKQNKVTNITKRK